MLGKSLQTRNRPETLFRVCRCARKCRPGHSCFLRLEDVASVAPSIEVKILHLSTPHVHAGVAAACPCGRTLRSWSDVFPCGTAVLGRWTGVAVRGFVSGMGPAAVAVGRVAPTGRTCPQPRAGTGRMGTQAALTTILYVYDTPDNNRTRTIVYCCVCPGFAVVPALWPRV